MHARVIIATARNRCTHGWPTALHLVLILVRVGQVAARRMQLLGQRLAVARQVVQPVHIRLLHDV